MKVQRKSLNCMTLILAAVLMLSWLHPSMGIASDSGESDLRTFGDIMQFALPAAGLAGTFIADDPEGRYQWGMAVGGTALTVQVWKGIASKTRPDAEGDTSFPSGHTSGAFSGAAFIDTRYGHWWGIPAYICAIITGYSRIDADAHFWNDVVAGASTGMLFNWYFTSPYSERVSLMPTEMGDGYGMKLTVKDDAGSSSAKEKKMPQVIKYPNYTYIFKFGPAWQDKNIVRAPNSGGTEFDFSDYENIDEPISTADVSLDIRLAERHKILVGYAPYENRDRTTLTEPFTFGNQDFVDVGETIMSAYRLHEIRAQYSYGLLLDDSFSFFIGGGVAWEDVTIEIQQGDLIYAPDIHEEVTDSIFLPYLYLRGGYNFTDKIEGFLEMDGIALDEDKLFNLFAGFNYHFNYHWYTGIGYIFSSRQIDTDTLYNEYQFQGVQAQVAYTF